MSARYPLAARRRRRYRRPRGRLTARQVAAAIACGTVLAVAAHQVSATPAAQAGISSPARVQSGTVTGTAAVAIAYARAQLGKPYLWGGTGPGGFDCSGLVMQAWAAARVSIPRTSQAQWAALPHIPASQVRPGDLVFFPGADGTWAAPGHVAMVLSATTMLQAYATGTPVEISPLNGNGAGGIVGYARPDGA